MLKEAGIKQVIDTRLNNVSQLSGFTKRADLEYFLQSIGGINYVHILDLAPTQDILDEYKKNKGDWAVYQGKRKKTIEKLCYFARPAARTVSM